jgi:hypothetical protein
LSHKQNPNPKPKQKAEKTKSQTKMLSPKEFQKKHKRVNRDKDASDATSDGDKAFFAVYQRVYDQINHIVEDGSLDFSNVDVLIKAGMEAVDFVSADRSPALSGTEKAEICKKLIVHVLQDLGEKGKIPKDICDKVVLAVNTLGPVMFKLIIMASKGQFDFAHMFGADGTGCCAKPGCCTVV